MTEAIGSAKRARRRAAAKTRSGGSEKKAQTFDSRYEANLAFFALSDEEREGLHVAEDEKTGKYRVEPKGK